MAEAALDNWQAFWNEQMLISKPVCVNFEQVYIIAVMGIKAWIFYDIHIKDWGVNNKLLANFMFNVGLVRHGC